MKTNPTQAHLGVVVREGVHGEPAPHSPGGGGKQCERQSHAQIRLQDINTQVVSC